jgi:hypothetical protein
MGKKAGTEVSVPKAEAKPTLEEFRDAIMHVLMKEHGAPELVARALLDSEEDYIRRALEDDWGVDGKASILVFEVAGEIVISPPRETAKYVFVDKDMVLVEVSKEADKYLKELLGLGLHGETRHEVARAMMARGIETVFPLLRKR